MKKDLKISQCMIVKNEEKNIQQALSWGKGVVWEQIVVDTGSTDRTVELAEAMGAKVYHFAWINDFSAAKNFAISKASGDWIGFLDADEYLTEEWAKKLPFILMKADKGSYYGVRSPLVSLNDAGEISSVARHCRFFKHLPGLVYEGAIHEVLSYGGKLLLGEGILDVGESLPVYHTGYAESVMKQKNKLQRNIDLLKAELEKHPADYNTMGYLADCYKGISPDEAEKWYREAIAHMPRKIYMGDERSALTFVYLLALLWDRQAEEEFLKIYEQAVARVPWDYDMDYLAGWMYQRKKEYGKALKYYERVLQISERYGADAYGIFLQANIAEFWEQLAICYYETGNLSACVQYCVTLLKSDNRRTDALAVLLMALKDEKPEDVLRFLGNLYKVQDASDRIFLIRGAVRAKAGNLLDALKQECTPEEVLYLEQAKEKICQVDGQEVIDGKEDK